MRPSEALPQAAVLPALVWLGACVVAALAAAVMALRALPGRRWGSTALGVGLSTLLGGAVRLLLVPRTPEIRWRLDLSFSEFGLEDATKYGIGWPLFVKAWVALTGWRWQAPFDLNQLLGTLLIPAAAALAHRMPGARRRAEAVAFVVATTPLLAWYANTDGPFAADALLVVAAAYGVLAYGQTGALAPLLFAAAVTVLDVQLRIESVLLLPLLLALAVLTWPSERWRTLAPWGVAAVAALALLPHLGLVGVPTVLEAARRSAHPANAVDAWSRFRFAAFTPGIQGIGWVLLALVGLGASRVPVGLRGWAFGGLVVSAALVPGVAIAPTAFSVLRYQHRSLVFAALLAGWGLARCIDHGRFGRAAAVALGMVAIFDLRLAAQSSVLGRELAFVQAALPKVPDGCEIFAWSAQGDRTLAPPRWVSMLAERDHLWRDIVRDDVPTDGRCVVYYRSGGCGPHYVPTPQVPPPLDPVCAAFEASWRLTPLSVGVIDPDPVGPMGVENHAVGVPIEVGFFRVSDLAPAREP